MSDFAPHLNRRRWLRSAALAAASTSPFLRSLGAALEPPAAGANRAHHPLRFVFCVKSNGLWAEMVQPRGLEDRLPFALDYDGKGRLVNGDHGNVRKRPTPAADLSLDDPVPLNDLMAPLAPFADRISVLQGINSGFNVYHAGQYQTLGAFQGKRRNSIETLGPTVDAVLARAFSRPVPHVCLGHDPKSPSGVAYVPTSAEGEGKPLPFYTRPERAYQELFGVVDDGAARAAYDTQSEILDFFAADAERLRAKVAAPERDQLERYLGAFDSLRRSRRAVEAMGDRLRRHAPEPPAPGAIAAGATTEIGQANAEIAVAALLSGLTNVVTLRFDLLGSTTYEGIGGLHGGVGHGQVKDVLGARKKICRFQFEQIARIAAALAAVPEPGGDGATSLLDNTVIVYLSDNGETHHSGGVNYPVLLLGDLGGRLARRRYFAPGNPAQTERIKPGYTRLGDLWATLLAAAGQPFKDFGLPLNGVPHQPIEPLMG